jgi:hypothetical protein
MSIIFDELEMPDGSTLPIHAKVASIKVFEPKTHHRQAPAVRRVLQTAHRHVGPHPRDGCARTPCSYAVTILAAACRSSSNVEISRILNF